MVDEFVNDDGERLKDDFDKQIESTIFKQGQDYAARNKRSKDENKGRAESRAAIKSLGMNPSAYAQAIKLIKDLTPNELKDWKRDFELTLKVMGGRQAELFPAEALKAAAREARLKDKAAGAPRSQAELDAKTDTDPASAPRDEPTIMDAIAAKAAEGTYHEAEGATAAAANEAAELAEGAAVLDQAPTNAKADKAPPKVSQSAKGNAKRAAAGMN